MRWLVRVLIVVLGLIVIGAGGTYVWLLSSLPQLDGQLAVPNLEAPVDIVRDRHGIPHIYAESERDAYFALGFVHAQDRLWQMELNRRIGAGRLAEIVGERAADFDRFLRTLSVYDYSKRNFARLDADTRAIFEAYAEGVNAFLTTRRGAPPPEFVLLRHRPEPWQPADSLVWGKMMAWSLGTNWSNELLRARLAERLSASQIADFFPQDGGVAIFPPRELTGLKWRAMLDELARMGPAWPHPANGSNNWVIAGRHTVSGKPLLAHDPHLGLAVPSVWYFVHLSAPGLDIIGATLPGLPGILLGRNQRLAWGFTNTGPDVQDLFIEKLSPSDPGWYLAPGGEEPFEIRPETVKVRGGDDIHLTVRLSRHGPVLSDVLNRAGAAVGEGYVLALAWTALENSDTTPRAFLNMARATNLEEFVAALRDYETPQQNIVYADVDGHIAFYAPGRVPRRQDANDVMGRLPVPGWHRGYDWDGYIPFEELPHSFDPPSGVIATANDKIVPDDYPYHITFEWEPAYRVRRISELLESQAKHSQESFIRLQGDIVSPMAREFLPLLLSVPAVQEPAAQAHDLLRGWNGGMDRNRPEPLIFAAWYRELTRLVYADELGGMFGEAWGLRPIFMYDVLTAKPAWCDDVTTEAVEGCDEVIATAFVQAVAALAESYGPDPAEWRWGEAHPAHSRHQPFTHVPFLRRLFDIRFPVGGGAFTINRAQYSIASARAPFAAIHGPSMRGIYDLDDLDRSLYIHSTGQSGNPLSDLYDNFAERWGNVEYLPMTIRRDDIMAGALGTLRLRPSAAPPGSGG